MVFFLLIALVALAVLSPYILIVRKRKRMLLHLRAVAKQSGFGVRPLHRFVCFSPNRGRRYDLLFECKSHAYAVKLWSATKKNSTLVVNGGKVSEAVKLPDELSSDSRPDRTIKSKQRGVPVTQNNYRIRRGKPVISVLLCYPPNKEMVVLGKNGRKRLAVGDKLFDKLICSVGSFEAMLSNSSPQNDKIEQKDEHTPSLSS